MKGGRQRYNEKNNRQGMTGPWPADAGIEQQLQAGPPSTCCCRGAANSNTLFQQTHRLMASVERPLPGP